MRGAGIGTRLFPWARCRIFSQLHGASMLAPRWIQPRIGPLLRGGIALNAYHRQILLLGLFRRDGYITGFRRLWVSARAVRCEEPADLACFVRPPGMGAVLVSFS